MVAAQAVEMCMKKKMEFTSDVFQQVLDHLSQLQNPPLLTFRVLMLCANVLKDLRKFIVKEVLPRLLQSEKRLWEVNPKGWEGVLRACKGLAGHRHASPLLLSILSLPLDVFVGIMRSSDVKEVGVNVLKYFNENSASMEVQEVVDQEKRQILEEMTNSKSKK